MIHFCSELDIRQHAGQDFDPEIFFVPKTISPTLNDPDFVVQTFDESERNIILWFTEGGNAVPVALNQFCKLLIQFKSLPF